MRISFKTNIDPFHCHRHAWPWYIRVHPLHQLYKELVLNLFWRAAGQLGSRNITCMITLTLAHSFTMCWHWKQYKGYTVYCISSKSRHSEILFQGPVGCMATLRCTKAWECDFAYFGRFCSWISFAYISLAHLHVTAPHIFCIERWGS